MSQVFIRCPLCDQRVPLAETPAIDMHGGQHPPLTYAQLASHGRIVFDETGRAWDVLCPQSSSPSSTPMLSRSK